MKDQATIPDVIMWKNGFMRLEEIRRKEIRESSILKDIELLQEVFDSARFLQSTKPESGLGKLGLLLIKMNR